MSDVLYKPAIAINLNAIVRNYQLLRGKGNNSQCAAVVKANAYGLGIDPIAPALYEAGCRHFFVATLDEAIELKAVFYGHNLLDAAIYVFHGARKGQAKDFLAHNIIPVLNDLGQVEHWKNAGKYALHIDTGMCRLGIAPEEADIKPGSNLQLVLSHLACANDPHDAKNREQLALFRQSLNYFSEIPASLANSSGIFLGSDYHFNLLRPGCSLYGISPNTSQPNPVENAVTLTAPILQYRTLNKDQTVGYSASTTARKGATLATVEIGYADGFLRSLSNMSFVYAAGIRVPVVGRVSMDMIIVDISEIPESMRDEKLRITLIGTEQPVDIIAKMAGTIGYELFTRLGRRIEKLYVRN